MVVRLGPFSAFDARQTNQMAEPDGVTHRGARLLYLDRLGSPVVTADGQKVICRTIRRLRPCKGLAPGLA